MITTIPHVTLYFIVTSYVGLVFRKLFMPRKLSRSMSVLINLRLHSIYIYV